jgi:hypothetical protein
MPVPDDHDSVMDALRLGWYVAEVRGRNEGRSQLPGENKLPKRTHHALPLRIERSPDELRIEAQQVLGALASKLQVNADSVNKSNFSDEVDSEAKVLAQASGAFPAPDSATVSPVQAAAAPAAIGKAGAAAMVAPGTPGAAESASPSSIAAGPIDVSAGDLDSLEDLIFRFDAHIQDTLAADSDTVGSAYQLGRALAECYWALDPGDPDSWASWSFLLG